MVGILIIILFNIYKLAPMGVKGQILMALKETLYRSIRFIPGLSKRPWRLGWQPPMQRRKT
jgi:hypothetical protein